MSSKIRVSQKGMVRGAPTSAQFLTRPGRASARSGAIPKAARNVESEALSAPGKPAAPSGPALRCPLAFDDAVGSRLAAGVGADMPERIRAPPVVRRMSRALNAPDEMVRRLDRGELSGQQPVDERRVQAHAIRERRSIDVPLRTRETFDAAFQPLMDRGRIMPPAAICVVDRREVAYVLGPPGTDRSHLARGLGVAAARAGRRVDIGTLVDLAETLRRSEHQDRPSDRVHRPSRSNLLTVDAIVRRGVLTLTGGLIRFTLPIPPGGAMVFLQLAHARPETCAFAVGPGPLAAPSNCC